MDGKLLAQARKEKENIRMNAVLEDRRRHEIAYRRVPELERLDNRITALVTQAAVSAIGTGRPIDELKQESLDLQARRAELLVENGWDMDWLDGAWECPKCRDEGFSHGQMCECLKKLYEKAQAKDLSALLKLGSESFGTFDLGLYDDKPTPPSRKSPREQMEIVFEICYDYAVNFKGKGANNLLLQGGTGLGKTFLSACIAREVAKQGFSVVYETAVAAMTAFEDQRFSKNSEIQAQADKQVGRMLECDLLILDDLGTELVTGFGKSALYTLINTRLINQKKTVISTNLSADELAENYTDQIASRLEGEYQIVPFIGTDIRKVKKERGI